METQAYPPVIRRIKKILPASSWQWVFPALRLDPIVWDSLCNYEHVFGVNDLAEIIHHPDDCTPAALALKALRYPRSPQELRILPLIPVEPAFREQVQSAETDSVKSLRESALLALNVRERRHSTGSWNDWTTLLETIPTTALACLYGMIPDQIEFLQALLPSQMDEVENEEPYRRLLRVILSNPAPSSVQLELVSLILQSLSPPEQELFLQAITAMHPTLAKSIPKPKFQPHFSSRVGKETQSPGEEIIHKIKKFTQQFPKALKIFDQRESDLKSRQLTQTIQFTAQTQALMLTKLAILSEINGVDSEATAYWQEAIRLQPQSESLRAVAILSYLSKERTEPNIDKPEFGSQLEPSTFLLQLAYRLLVEKSDILDCSPSTVHLINLAQQALQEVETTANSDPYLSDQEIQCYVLALLTTLMITKGFYALAQQAVLRLLKQNPNHSTLLSLLAILLHVQGLHSEALNLLHLIESLHPEDDRLSPLLAQSHAVSQEWQSALQIWQNHSTPTSQSIYERITCARFSDQEALAVEECISALKAKPRDGILLSLLAEVDRNQDRSQRWELHQQATLLDPAEPYVWLSYARTAQVDHDDEKALSLLKAAEQTLLNNPFIQCALGDLYLVTGQPSLALPHLQAAAALTLEYRPFSIALRPHQLLVEGDCLPQFIETLKLRFNPDWGSTLITFDQWYGYLIARLSKALLQLGHREEAQQTLESAFEKYPSNADLAHQLAQLKMTEGNFEEAGQIIKEIVLGNIKNLQAAIDFARCALHVPKLATNDEVILTLQKVLEDQPENFEALTLLAQAFVKSDQPQAALKLYDQILRLPQAHEPNVKEQIAYAMSQAALNAGEYELALTTLLECNQQEPGVQRLLAETYFHLGLPLEAAQAAQAVRSVNPSDLETLIWYANLLTRLAQSVSSHSPELLSSAIAALQQSVELAPQRGDLKLLLAETLYEAGEHWQAKEILLQFVPEDRSETNISETELVKAAQYLTLLGEPRGALACYEKSVTLLQAADPIDSEKISEILRTMADIYHQQKRYPELATTLERAMDLRPNDLSLFIDYIATWTHANNDPSQRSINSQKVTHILNLFEHHLDQNPEDRSLIFLYSLFLRWTGNSEKAIDLLSQLLSDLASSEGAPNTPKIAEFLVAILIELSRIHRSRGEYQLADYWLSKWNQQLVIGSDGVNKATVEFYCDWLQSCITHGEDCQNLLLDICNQNPDHPRLIALMSYIKLHQGDFRGAKMLFETALPAITERENSPTGFHPAIVKFLDASNHLETLYTFATVAQRLGEWNLACEFLNQAVRLDPEGIRSHWERLKSLVLRAEFQHLCERLDIVTHAMGEIALASEALRDFETSVQFLRQNAAHLISESIEETYPLDEWIERGKLAFSPSREDVFENIRKQLSAEILSGALLVASQDSLQKHIALAEPYQEDPFIRFQIAAAMISLQPQWAVSLLENLLQHLENSPFHFSPKRGWLLSRKHSIALVGAAYANAVLKCLASNAEWVAAKRSMALQALDTALELFPDEPKWHLYAAQLASLDQSTQESKQKAISHLEQAIQWNGHSLDIHLKLAQLYLDIQKIDSAIQILESASHLDEQNSQIDYWLAQAYLKQHDFELAAQYAQTAIEKNPIEINYILLRGEIALQMKDAATALQVAEQALDQPIEDPRIWGLFAQALHAAGKTEDALRVLQQTIPEKAEYLDLHIERIEILRQWRGAEAALQEINHLLSAFPQVTQLLLYQAEVLAELGEIESAISTAQSALRQSHQSPSTARLEDHAHSHRLLGDLFFRNGHLDQAVYHLSEAIHLKPNDETAYFTLGDIYLSRGENERALTAYQQCLKINPENSQAYYKSGVLYKELKDYLTAEQMLRQAAKLDPNNLAIQRQLGAVVALNLIHTRRTKEKNTP